MKVEPIIRLLAGLLLVYTLFLFAANYLFPDDGQFYQTLSGVETGIFGLLAGLLVPRKSSSEIPASPGSSQKITTLTEETVKAPNAT